MMRPWYAVVFAFLILVPVRSFAVGSFELPSPSAFLKQAHREPIIRTTIPGPVEINSGRWESNPDWAITPGILCTLEDQDFKELRYPERIAYCRRHTTIAHKKEVSRWYGVRWEDHSNFQYDHLLSLCLGGSNDLRNLWPMPFADARSKAKLEAALCRRLAKGEITQADAVKQEIGWFFENAPGMLPVLLGEGPGRSRPFGPS